MRPHKLVDANDESGVTTCVVCGVTWQKLSEVDKAMLGSERADCAGRHDGWYRCVVVPGLWCRGEPQGPSHVDCIPLEPEGPEA